MARTKSEAVPTLADHAVIVPQTVREILDEQIARKLI
jgi:hypothetical protein